jgi:hypothetical protein
MSENEKGEQPVEASGEKVSGSISRSLSESIRSLSGVTGEPMPVQTGDPQPGGIRPGPETGHTPQNAAPEVAPTSTPSTDSQASADS